MTHQHQPVSRLRANVSLYSITEEDNALQSVPRFVVLDSNAVELNRFRSLADAMAYAHTLARQS